MARLLGFLPFGRPIGGNRVPFRSLSPRFLSSEVREDGRERKKGGDHLSFRIGFQEDLKNYYGLSRQNLAPRFIFPLSSSSSSIKEDFQKELQKQFPILKYIPHELSLSSSGNSIEIDNLSDNLGTLRQFKKIVVSQNELEARPKIEEESLLRIISFYRFFPVSEICHSPEELLFKLKAFLRPLGVKGRIYVAEEGFNAQIGVPSSSFPSFVDFIKSNQEFQGVELNEDDPVSSSLYPFPTLDIRTREKVVADGGLDLDWNKSGQYLSPDEWDEALSKGHPILDCRNDYEFEVGRFEGAEPLKTNTFRETWEALYNSPSLKNLPKNEPVMIYCTGGIRCEKVGAFLEQEMGFSEVKKLKGGLVKYKREVAAKEGKESKFKGINYVFDNRLGSRISSDILSECDQCGTCSDVIKNCANVNCGVRFIQCDSCAADYGGCCCYGCYVQMRGKIGEKDDPKSFDFPLLLLTNQPSHPTPTLHPPFQNSHLNLLLDSSINFSFPTSPSSPSPPPIPHKPFLEPLLSPSSPTNIALDWAREQAKQCYPFAETMTSCSKQCMFLSSFVRLLGEGEEGEEEGRKRVLDVGGFVGCSALSLGRGLGEEGEVYCIEKDKGAAKIAKEAFEQAENKQSSTVVYHLVEDNAVNALSQMKEQNEKFSFAFVDCDKKGYQQYYQLLFGGEEGEGGQGGLLTEGGVAVFDNVLWKGMVAEVEREKQTKQPKEATTLTKQEKRHKVIAESLHNFLKFVRNDPQTECSLLPVRDGLLIVKRKGSMRTTYPTISQILKKK